jgi:hypothetical protein
MAQYLLAMLEGGIAPSTVREWLEEPDADIRAPRAG